VYNVLSKWILQDGKPIEVVPFYKEINATSEEELCLELVGDAASAVSKESRSVDVVILKPVFARRVSIYGHRTSNIPIAAPRTAIVSDGDRYTFYTYIGG